VRQEAVQAGTQIDSASLDVAEGDGFNLVDCLRDELNGLDERRENRFSGKDFGIIGKAYASGRVSFFVSLRKWRLLA
jgi:hypothetical protein